MKSDEASLKSTRQSLHVLAQKLQLWKPPIARSWDLVHFGLLEQSVRGASHRVGHSRQGTGRDSQNADKPFVGSLMQS